jgi:hypothetical protein
MSNEMINTKRELKELVDVFSPYYFKQREQYLFGATPLYSRNFRIK